jgi:hypothetical protein
LLAQALIFFFKSHAFTLLGFTTFGKSRANLGSYEIIINASVFTIYSDLIRGIINEFPHNNLLRNTTAYRG